MNFLKQSINEIKRFYNIPTNVEQLYTEEAATKNGIAMTIIAAFMIVVEAFNISRVLFFSKSGLATTNNRIYFTMYLVLLISAIVFRWLDSYFKHKTIARTHLQITATYAWMLWHVVLNCYDLHRNPDGDITIFSCAVLGLAIFAQIKPRYTLSLATLSYLILTSFSGGALDTGSYINATITLVLACLIALRVYTLSIIQIEQHIEISIQSEQLRNERAELKSNLEKYEMVLNNTNDQIFEIDFHKERLLFAPNSRFAKRFGREITNLTEWLHTQPVVSPEDADHLIAGIHDIIATGRNADFTFQMHTEDNISKWYRLRIFIVHSDDDLALHGIGIITDIDTQYRQVATLTSQAATDQMTGLLNAAAFKKNYELALRNTAENEQLVMLMLDLDCFKSINDTYGHFIGDCVLKEVAHALLSTFRDYDACARLGGDEFAVLMQKVKDPAIISAKAGQLAESIAQIEATEHKIHFTCSIGAAMTKDTHTTYTELYQAADKALYNAKAAGRNCYKISAE